MKELSCIMLTTVQSPSAQQVAKFKETKKTQRPPISRIRDDVNNRLQSPKVIALSRDSSQGHGQRVCIARVASVS